MSQQGGRPTGHEDDWWGQLYDSTGDTGPAPAPDSLDDRFASAAGAVGDQGASAASDERPGPGRDAVTDRPYRGGADPVVPMPRAGADDVRDAPAAPRPTDRAPWRAPWEPPPARPTGPVTFPTPTKPPDRAERPPERPSGGGAAPPSGPSGVDAAPPSGPSGVGAAPPSGAPRPSAGPGQTSATAPAGSSGAPRPSAGPGQAPAAAPDRPSESPRQMSATSPARPSEPPRSSAGPGQTPATAPARPSEPPRPSAGPGQVSSTPPASPSGPGSPEKPRQAPAATPSLPRTPPAPPAVPPPPPVSPAWPGPEDRRPAAVAESPQGAAPSAAAAEPATAAFPAVAGPPPTPPPPTEPPPTEPPPDNPGPRIEPPATGPRPRGHVGSRPPTYDAEPTALPPADPDDLDDLVADTVLDGARYGSCTLRAVSLRGDSARYRGEPRRDSLLTARFGTGEQALLLVAMATGARATPGAHRAAAEACHWIGRAVGRSHTRLVEDIRAGRRGDLKSGLHRLTDRSLGKLRASAAEQGVDPEEYAAGLRCLLLPADPECRTRVFFGVGPGGLFRLREGEWQDIEPQVTDVRGEPVLGFGSPPSETPEGDRLTMDLGIPTPPSPYEPAPEPPREPFRFRTSVARPGDTLLMCSSGLADPLRGEPELCEYLADRWSRPEPPGLAAFLADSQVRVKGYADDRTAAAVWEA
ncbi:protein phosphatase 2C domain-containing protein [Streptomyces lomondensis]|uniref:protein phosphatase 2C domain-containing protein n=1 Tax=Streptomyces lomondensis TaxID=68229 RepID=UPI001675CD17|nr:protein phosphatase 2C domain-containing protein [Streptomyces lomondensis]MCF0077342.1 protein phosphatase 2C domain-containing protein [Streptomyces lomondensis]